MASCKKVGLMWALLALVASAAPPTILSKNKKELGYGTCQTIECPSYEVVYDGDEFSIRHYNGTVWMATSVIQDTSFYNATRVGFLKLFAYIQGENEQGATVNMTAPVLTGIIPSDGPFCMSSFIVRFFVPTVYGASPPTPVSSLDLQVEEWKSRYYAVRQFGGFATDTNVAEEGASLEVSLYEAGVPVIATSDEEESYFIAQYNSPFEITGRLNEVWLPVSDSCLLEKRS